MGYRKRDEKKQIEKANKFIQELELDLIEFTSSSMEEKMKQLPLTDPKSIRCLLWNLDRNRSQLSYNDWDLIVKILIDRLC